ncbi:hypothetical protein NDU88_003615 [Pleurodeles waltl]|uniref:Uncharacterized protein n=1 Tax=Pleurodeles waltl TaxID=8319 RepID=A0AAV7TNV8_PLEWA|nr:hypothetical protein NDU88_003615 [Pleurodeles waltl]
MEEDQVVDQKDDLERMRAEALNRGKDWLFAKMEEKGEERQNIDILNPSNPHQVTDTNNRGSPLPPQKASKRQRMEGKVAKKTPKKARGTDRPTGAPSTREPAEISTPYTPAECEHISAIIKKNLESFAPLLLKGSGAGLSIDGAETGESPGHAGKSGQLGGQSSEKDQTPKGDPTAAWDATARATGRVLEPPLAAGNPPESYIRPFLGPSAMTTRAAGLATAIPLAVKERIWRKEFIDIFSLLEIQVEGLDLAICDKKEEDRREKKRARKERNFENWLSAFRIMAW